MLVRLMDTGGRHARVKGEFIKCLFNNVNQRVHMGKFKRRGRVSVEVVRWGEGKRGRGGRRGREELR